MDPAPCFVIHQEQRLFSLGTCRTVVGPTSCGRKPTGLITSKKGDFGASFPWTRTKTICHRRQKKSRPWRHHPSSLSLSTLFIFHESMQYALASEDHMQVVLVSIIHHPSFIIDRSSSIIHHPASITHHTSCIIHHPSSIFHLPSSIIHHSSSIIQYSSSIVHHRCSAGTRSSSYRRIFTPKAD